MSRIFFFLTVSLLTSATLWANTYTYTLSWDNPASHQYYVSLSTATAEGNFTDFQLPAWRPGRYYFQDYAAAVTGFQASTTADPAQQLRWEKTGSHTWRVYHEGQAQVTIAYRYYANTMDAGSSVLSPEEAYFNPVNLLMHRKGVYDWPCTLHVPSMPADWKAATALRKAKGSHNLFEAKDYHELVDSPTILSPTLKTLHSRIGETDFYFHFQGPMPNDKSIEDAFQGNLNAIIEEQIAIFGEIPLEEYHFIYHLLPFNIGHAVEHSRSASFAMPASVAESAQRIRRLNSISSHEFFHLWNVKRIRPAAMWPYDYQVEQPTTLHWFTEGVTDYFTNLVLVRADLITREQYFNILARTIESLENGYASHAVSPSQSSFDSWLERSDYGLPAHRISYYTLGTRVGLLLDLELRRRTGGTKSLDDLFRLLYAEYFQQGRGMPEDGVQKAMEKLSGDSWQAFFDAHVHGTAPIDYDVLLQTVGLELVREPKMADWSSLGLEQKEAAGGGWYLSRVRPDSPLEKAGIGSGDIVLSVEGKSPDLFESEAFFSKMKKGSTLEMGLYRNGKVETVVLTVEEPIALFDFSIREVKKPKEAQKKALEAWLGTLVN